jgi:four helix bundle protein
MLGACAMAHKLEDLHIFNEAQKFCAAVTATLQRSRLPRNCNRYKQIVDANDSILSNMDEGFEQASDDGFANYLVYSKGSIAEVMRRLHRAALRKVPETIGLQGPWPFPRFPGAEKTSQTGFRIQGLRIRHSRLGSQD